LSSRVNIGTELSCVLLRFPKFSALQIERGAFCDVGMVRQIRTRAQQRATIPLRISGHDVSFSSIQLIFDKREVRYWREEISDKLLGRTTF
jgi:hypothetical protein